MTDVFLTGVTGFIGSHVAQALVQSGYRVRAIVRPHSVATHFFRHKDIVLAQADILEPNSLREAMSGCYAVVHVAAMYAFWNRPRESIYNTNVRGTYNVLEAARKEGVQRIVHTSSVGTLGFHDRTILSEDATLATESEMVGDYKRSKFEAERLVLRMASAGAPIVVVNPSTPIGPGDEKPTPTGKIILDFLNRKLPAFVDTGLNFVHINDVAAGHVLALEHGVPGERYILGNLEGNLSLAQFLQELSDITGISAPRLQLPHWLVLAAAHVDEFFRGTIVGRPPAIPLEAARMSKEFMWVDPTKAINYLGLPQTNIRSALSEAVDWFVRNEYAQLP